NSCAGIPKIDQDIEDGLMRRNVKIIGGDFFDDLRDRIARRDQHRAKDALLGFATVRRGAMCGEYRPQTLCAESEYHFSASAPPSLGQHHFLTFEALDQSRRMVESP